MNIRRVHFAPAIQTISASADTEAEVQPSTPTSSRPPSPPPTSPVPELRASGPLSGKVDFALDAAEFADAVRSLLGNAADAPASTDEAHTIIVRFVHWETGKKLGWTPLTAHGHGHGTVPLTIYDVLRKTRRTMHETPVAAPGEDGGQRMIDVFGPDTFFHSFSVHSTRGGTSAATSEPVWTLELTGGFNRDPWSTTRRAVR